MKQIQTNQKKKKLWPLYGLSLWICFKCLKTAEVIDSLPLSTNLLRVSCMDLINSRRNEKLSRPWSYQMTQYFHKAIFITDVSFICNDTLFTAFPPRNIKTLLLQPWHHSYNFWNWRTVFSFPKGATCSFRVVMKFIFKTDEGMKFNYANCLAKSLGARGASRHPAITGSCPTVKIHFRPVYLVDG